MAPRRPCFRISGQEEFVSVWNNFQATRSILVRIESVGVGAPLSTLFTLYYRAYTPANDPWDTISTAMGATDGEWWWSAPHYTGVGGGRARVFGHIPGATTSTSHIVDLDGFIKPADITTSASGSGLFHPTSTTMPAGPIQWSIDSIL
jgi:hypothetical protein